MNFLPINITEAKKRGWESLDVIIICADAYVDHPSFSSAIIGRYLESLGIRVGIISQPDINNPEDFKVLGKPEMFFGITAGNLDSMVALYTSSRKIRSEDAYSPGGRVGVRPYLPTIAYTNAVKSIYKDVPVILGGIEASLRRTCHYDYYKDKLRGSILLDSKADLLIYGNGEAPLKDLISEINNGKKINEIKFLRGIVAPINKKDFQSFSDIKKLPDFESIKKDKKLFNKMTMTLMNNLNPNCSERLFQNFGSRGILINSPAFPLSEKEIDSIYNLPFTRKKHPSYKKNIPALKIVENSIQSHRGCYGGCSFCAIALHQGKFIQSRSENSIFKEIKSIIKNNKNVTIADIGGPTANMYGTYCSNKNAKKNCKRNSCLYPEICDNLIPDSKRYEKLLKKVLDIKEVNHLFINSGIRMDLALKNPDFIKKLACFYTQGQLSLAPEHVNPDILALMNKPSIKIFNKFTLIFNNESSLNKKRQFVMPYFIIGHPGADENSEKELADFVKKSGIKMKQIQEFYPTPMSLATAMYYTGLNPVNNKKINIEKKSSVKRNWKNRIIGKNQRK